MIVYSDGFLKHHMDGHPENRERLRAIKGFLQEMGVFETLPLVEPQAAGKKDILLVHSKRHLEEMKATSGLSSPVYGDTYFTGETYRAALLAAGGVLTALNSSADTGFALVRPPGHHATRDRAMGFCIFNNVAVGAAYAREKGYKKAAILDFDLHHGNGTQEIFYEDRVLYISLHQWPHYPGTGSLDELGAGEGMGYTINIPLPAGTGDESYGLALDEIVFPVLEDFGPELLLVSAGYDAHFSDPLGGLQLSTETYLRISEDVKGLAKKSVFSLEGGYNLLWLPRCVHASLQGLYGLEGEERVQAPEESRTASDIVRSRIRSLRDALSPYWSL
ncbi:MAG: histone deacetylase [Methanobacteriota archaeon]|nr:MAG: histone deacetylase [Euryarchaeota archaeon]